jgi:hypothetical protein
MRTKPTKREIPSRIRAPNDHAAWIAQTVSKTEFFDPETFRNVVLLARPRRDYSMSNIYAIFTHLIFFRSRFCGSNMPAITDLAAPIDLLPTIAQPLWFRYLYSSIEFVTMSVCT